MGRDDVVTKPHEHQLRNLIAPMLIPDCFTAGRIQLPVMVLIRLVAVAVLLVTACGGCTDDFAWGTRDIPVRAVNGGPGWRSTVERAAERWNSLITDRCGWTVFAITDHEPAHPVTLVPDSGWHERDGMDAWTDSDQIQVRDHAYGFNAELGVWRIELLVAHELGHAIGLEHTTEAPSAMEETGRSRALPSALDADEFARVSGCQ